MPERFFIRPQANPARPAAEKLFEILKPKIGSADFGNSFVIAPTKDSARAIAAEFASLCDKEGGCACAGLEFATPNALLETACPHMPKAGIFECLGAFKKVLERLDTRNFPALFPRGRESLNLAAFSKVLKKLRGLLSEAAHGFASVSELAERCNVADSAKWRELAEIERLYLAELERISKSDPDFLLAEVPKNPAASPDAVILAGLPDAPKIFRDMLETMEARGTRVISIVVSGKPELFDALGMPLDAWREEPMQIENRQIIVCADAREQARGIAGKISKLGGSPGELASVACEEGAAMRLLRAELAACGIKSFSPEGRKLSDSDVFAFLAMLKKHYENAEDGASFALLRTPLFTNFISKKSGLPCSEIRAIADEYASEKLCASLARAVAAARGVEGRVFLEAAAILEQTGERTSALLEKIFSRVLGIPQAASPDFVEACESLAEGLKLLKNAESAGFSFSAAEALQTLAEHCDRRVFDEARRPGEVYVKNWLEIFWAAEPHIFIGDFNDGKVPEKTVGDALVPDSLREKLGIRGNAARHARDAAMLDAMLEARKSSLEFFVPKTDADGGPLQPSRLLLQNAPDILSRVKTLFEERPSSRRASAFEKSWSLKARRTPTPEFLSATDFKIYLECPFRFYLERLLKASAFDPEKAELDAMQLGSAVHDAFLKAAKIQTQDAGEIAEALVREFERSLKRSFGSALPPAVMMQAGSMAARLRAAAEIEAEHRLQGWESVSLEEAFEPFAIGAFKVKARIDRIDRHPDGRLLVIDYKTGDSFTSRKNASPAEAAHLKFSKAGGEPQWKDLQLPLYRHAAMEKYGTRQVACAYFTLPKNPEESSLEIWEISEELQQSAMECAELVAKKISNGEFEPSEKSPLVKYHPELFGWTDPENLKNFVETER